MNANDPPSSPHERDRVHETGLPRSPGEQEEDPLKPKKIPEERTPPHLPKKGDCPPPKQKKSQQRKDPRGKTLIPQPWELTDEMIAWAESEWPRMNVRKTTEQWEDSMISGKYLSGNWKSSWKNGMRFAVNKGIAIDKTTAELIREMNNDE